MSEFHREDRYIVIKRSDMGKADVASLGGFNWAFRNLNDSMLGNGAPARSFLVIESDWPEYKPVWQMIEARMNGEPNALDAALAREADLRDELNGYEPASSGTASKRARWLVNIQDACKYGLPKHLVGRLNNTAKEIQNSIKYGGTKRLRDENEALQQRLTDAEKRIDAAVTALNEIAKVSRIGEKPFEIATLAIGEMSALKRVED